MKKITLTLLISLTSFAEGGPVIQLASSWKCADCEIRTPNFSANSKKIVFVTKRSIVDGHEAEGLPQNYFAELQAKVKAEPRYLDPSIRVISSEGVEECAFGYGWTPAISDDGTQVIYSRQVDPLSLNRELAEPLAKNALYAHSCKDKTDVELYSSKLGAVENPTYSTDGKSVIFAITAPTNGAYSSMVGADRISISRATSYWANLTGSRGATSLFAVSKAPQAPLPPESQMTPALRQLCEHNYLSKNGFYKLLGTLDVFDGAVLGVESMPRPAACDLYTASSYDNVVRVLSPTEKIVYKQEGGKPFSIQAMMATNQRVLVFRESWEVYELKTGSWSKELKFQNTKPQSVYTRDLNFYLEAGKNGTAILRDAQSGKAVFTFPSDKGYYAPKFSDDSSKLAIVAAPKSAKERWQELQVYNIR